MSNSKTQRALRTQFAILANLACAAAGMSLMVGCSGAKSVSVLTAELADPDPDVRYDAAKALEQFGPEAAPAVPALAVTLRDDNGKVRYRAAKALSKVETGLGPAVAALGEALGDDDREVRYYAAKALEDADGESKPSEAAIVAALGKEPDAKVRYYLVKSLQNLGPAPTTAAALQKASQDADEQVRQAATNALKDMKR